MDPESKKMLEETLALERDSNQILHKVRSVQKWSTVWQTFKIVVIIGIAVGAFYFLEPFVNKLIVIWNNISGSQQEQLNSNPIQDFLKKFAN